MKKKTFILMAGMMILMSMIAANAMADCDAGVAILLNGASGVICPQNDQDPSEYIFCSYSYSVVSGIERAVCYAVDNDTYRQCDTTDPALVRIVASLNPGDNVTFVKAPGATTCASIQKN